MVSVNFETGEIVTTLRKSSTFNIDCDVVSDILGLYGEYLDRKDGITENYLYFNGVDEDNDIPFDLHISMVDSKMRFIFIDKETVDIDFCDIDEFMLQFCKYIVKNKDNIEDVEKGSVYVAKECLLSLSGDRELDYDPEFRVVVTKKNNEDDNQLEKLECCEENEDLDNKSCKDERFAWMSFAFGLFMGFVFPIGLMLILLPFLR